MWNHRGKYFIIVIYNIVYTSVTFSSFARYRVVLKVFTPVTCEITKINFLSLWHVTGGIKNIYSCDLWYHRNKYLIIGKYYIVYTPVTFSSFTSHWGGGEILLPLRLEKSKIKRSYCYNTCIYIYTYIDIFNIPAWLSQVLQVTWDIKVFTPVIFEITVVKIHYRCNT